jgi:hypothetical protein
VLAQLPWDGPQKIDVEEKNVPRRARRAARREGLETADCLVGRAGHAHLIQLAETLRNAPLWMWFFLIVTQRSTIPHRRSDAEGQATRIRQRSMAWVRDISAPLHFVLLALADEEIE